jgi:hypothetical protein
MPPASDSSLVSSQKGSITPGTMLWSAFSSRQR